MPTREIYWNITGHNWMYLLMVISIAVCIFGYYRRYQLWRLGTTDKRTDQMGRRIVNVLVNAVAHKRVLREKLPGTMHFTLFWGFIIFTVGTFFVALDADLGTTLYRGSLYLGLSFILDIAGLMVIIALLFFLWRRYITRPDRLDNKPDDLISLFLLLFIVITGFVLEGIRIVATNDAWAQWSPVGLIVGRWLSPVDIGTLKEIHLYTWWIHLLLAFGFIGYLPYSKLMHIVTSPLNQLFASLKPQGALEQVNLENEEAETFGIEKLEHFTWKQLLDADACTRCGRCQDNCPAYQTQKPLSPKEFTQDLRKHLNDEGGRLLQAKSIIKKKLPFDAASAGADIKLAGGVFSTDTIWSCTTCRSCQEHCPVYVEHIDKMIGLRRNLVLVENNFPPEIQTVFKNLENNGNPWGVGWAKREDWAEGLGVKTLAEEQEVEYLYWIGCAGAFDERNKQIAKAVVTILQKAGVSFGILGKEEKCCGDSARRIGNEYLYQTLAAENIATMNKYKVKKIITNCPHCYNTLKNEYLPMGGNYQLIHLTEFIWELLSHGEICQKNSEPLTVTYHDSCYLGRYNNIYDAPRSILKKIPAVKLIEMGRNREKSFCCGAGGGRMWMEEHLGSRINEKRTDEAISTCASIVVSNCPFCLTMFEDGIKSKEKTDQLKVLDIAEIVSEHIL